MTTELFYSPGACSLAPHILLEESGLPYVARAIPIAEGAHRRADYLAINPRGRVPALRLDGTVFTEAPALLTLIAGLARPRLDLLPAEPRAAGRAAEWMAFLSSSVHVAYAQLWRPERFLPSGSDPAALERAGRDSIAGLYEEIERRVGDGAWALGEAYSAVDPYLAVFWRWGRQRLELDMEDLFPRWSAQTERLRGRPAVARVLAREGITL